MIHPLAVDYLEQYHSLQLTDSFGLWELRFLRLIQFHSLFLQLLLQTVLAALMHTLRRHRLQGNCGQQQRIQLVVIPLLLVHIVIDADIHTVLRDIRDHLIDIVEPEYDYSVGDYYRDAKNTVEDILSRRKIPIIAGGTGLYFRVLLESYNLPEVETNYELRAELDKKDRAELLDSIRRLDKVTYERVKDGNKRRIVRALEMIETLGKPLSSLEIQKEPEYDVEWRMPELKSREWLYDRINRRVDLMAEQGIVDETKRLLEKHGRIKNFVSTIGYKEILEYLDGKCSLDEALDKLKQHTRNFAKRNSAPRIRQTYNNTVWKMGKSLY